MVKPDPEQYEVLKAGAHELELRFARPRDLLDPQLGTVLVLSGQVLVRTIVPDSPAMPSAPGSATPTPEFDDVTSSSSLTSRTPAASCSSRKASGFTGASSSRGSRTGIPRSSAGAGTPRPGSRRSRRGTPFRRASFG